MVKSSDEQMIMARWREFRETGCRTIRVGTYCTAQKNMLFYREFSSLSAEDPWYGKTPNPSPALELI